MIVTKLLRGNAAARPSPRDLLQSAWAAVPSPAAVRSSNKAEAGSDASTDEPLLLEAHAALHRWYDDLLFESMSDKLTRMTLEEELS